MNTRAVAVASLVLLAGCGGGGGSAPAPQQPPVQATPAAIVPAAAGSALLTLDVPRSGSSAQRAPKYVSPNSAKLVVTVLTVNGNAPSATQVPPALNPSTFALTTAPGGNCTVSPNGETCTVTIPAPTGQVTYQFDVFDAANNKLSTNTLTYTIAAGSSPSLQAQLKGIVSTVTVTAPTLTAGTSFSGPITVQAFDASGALIVGSAPYNNPFTLTDNDGTGATSLTDGSTTGLVVTVAGPNDVVILNFDGQDIDPFTITATVPGKAPATAGTVKINALTRDVPRHGERHAASEPIRTTTSPRWRSRRSRRRSSSPRRRSAGRITARTASRSRSTPSRAAPARPPSSP